MIRPFTCVCLLLAAGSGLYLYQTKHQTQVVDREIERTLKLADATWQRSGVLRAEYTLLNDPSRLADLSAQYLPTLQTTAPGQFSTLSDLDHRLPPVGPPPTEPAVADATPVTQPEVAAPELPPRTEIARTEPARVEPPRPELPRVEPPRPAMAALPTRPTAPTVAADPMQPRPVVIAPPRVVTTPTIARSVPAPAVTPGITNVAVVRPEPASPTVPFIGSALGMARTMPQPAPAYVPPPAGSLR